MMHIDSPKPSCTPYYLKHCRVDLASNCLLAWDSKMVWNFVLVNGDQSHLLKKLLFGCAAKLGYNLWNPKVPALFHNTSISWCGRTSQCLCGSKCCWMGQMYGNLGELDGVGQARFIDFVCLWAEHEKKLLFLQCIPLSFSPMCPPLFLLPHPAHHRENRFQMGWFCPHGEDVVVRLDCSFGPVQTCIIRWAWTWVIFWEIGSGAAARKVGNGLSVVDHR